jgi:hypothetical protein
MHSDALITIADRAEYLPFHPFCRQQIHHNYLNLVDDFDPNKEVSIAIRAISNSGDMGILYAVFNKKTMVLIPKQSNTLKDGVYITGFASIINEDTNSIRTDEYYSFEAALNGQSPVPIFASTIDAKKHINEDRRQIQTDEHKTFIAEVTLEKERLAMENSLLQVQMNTNKIKEEEKEAERQKEILKMKNEADQRILELKEASTSTQLEGKQKVETLKFISGCFAVGLTLWKIFG